MPRQLDNIDRELLRRLQLDARQTNKDLAKAAGLSPSACLRRIRRLEQSGVIRGYTALVDLGGGGADLVVVVRVTLEEQTEESMRRFEAAVRQHPEVEECYLMTGDVDYVLRVSSPDMAGYETVHTNVLTRLPGVARVHSSFALRNVLRARPGDRRRRSGQPS